MGVKSLFAVGCACTAASIGLFAAFTVASRWGFKSAISPLDMMMLRFGGASLLLLPSFLYFRRINFVLSRVTALALVGGLLFAFCAYNGLRLAPASHGAVVMHGSLPLTTCVASYLILRTPISSGQAKGLSMIVVGLFAMLWDSVRAASGAQLVGDCYLVAASFFWSLSAVLARRFAFTPLQTASNITVISLVMLGPFYLLRGSSQLAEISSSELIVQLGIQGVLMGIVSMVVYTQAVRILGAQKVALCTSAVPAVTLMGAIVLLNELPSVVELIGASFSTLGICLALKAPAAVGVQVIDAEKNVVSKVL